MANEWDPDDVFDVWADGRARQVLLEAADEPRSADELAEACDGSRSSIYRRVYVLRELGLLAEQVSIDADGHHYSVYECRFDHLRVRLETHGVAIDFRQPEDEGEQRVSGAD